MRQTVDALGYVLIDNGMRKCIISILHILREASASLSVLLYRAMREPLIVGWATSMALTLFY